MKVAGFTIIRNALKFDYPVVESITSVLPLVDEMVVSVGNSEDNTLGLILSINSPKIRIIQSVWDDSLREGGKLLAVETNKALRSVKSDADWCLYIQADEVLHEKYLSIVAECMEKYKGNSNVEGLLFDYVHFYGSYKYVADSPKWYDKEIRAIKNKPEIISWGDAQGFRMMRAGKAEKLRVKQINASIYHYGWVKNPSAQQSKQENFHKMWHDDAWVKQNVLQADEYDYGIIDSLKTFEDNHPQVMQPRVKSQNWQFHFDFTRSKMKWKYRLRKWIKDTFGISVGAYKNYILAE